MKSSTKLKGYNSKNSQKSRILPEEIWQRWNVEHGVFPRWGSLVLIHAPAQLEHPSEAVASRYVPSENESHSPVFKGPRANYTRLKLENCPLKRVFITIKTFFLSNSASPFRRAGDGLWGGAIVLRCPFSVSLLVVYRPTPFYYVLRFLCPFSHSFFPATSVFCPYFILFFFLPLRSPFFSARSTA